MFGFEGVCFSRIVKIIKETSYKYQTMSALELFCHHIHASPPYSLLF